METARRGSLEQRLPLTVTGLLLVVITVLVWAAQGQFERMLSRAATKDLSRVGAQLARLLEQGLATASQDVRAWAADSIVRMAAATGAPGDAAIARRLRELAAHHPSTIAVQLRTNAPARQWTAAGPAAGAVLPEARVPAGRIAAGLGALVAADTSVYYDMAVQVRGAAGPTATLIVRRRLASGGSGQLIATLIGDEAVLLVGSPGSGVWSDLSRPASGPAPVSAGDTAGLFRWGRHAAYYGAVVPLRGTEWKLWIGVPRHVVLAPVRTLVGRMAGLGGAVLLLGAFVSIAFSRRIARPLSRLTGAAERISRGDMDVRVDARGTRDEVGRLAVAFNRMADRVAGAQSELEAQVDARTEQTAKLERQAAALEAQKIELQAAAAALRESEQRFRSLVANATDLVTVVSPDGTIRFQSPNVGRMLGYTPESLRETSVFSLVHPDDRQAFAASLEMLRQQPGEARTIEHRFAHADGSWRLVESTGRNLLADPAVAGLVLNSHDVTERRRAEEALRRSEEQLRQSQKMEAIGRLAGGVAHDFNNMLTVISGNAALLQADGAQSGCAGEELDEIRAAATRAAALTRQLLAFSRREPIQPGVLDPNEVVRGVTSMLRRLVSEQISLRIALDPAAGRVLIDPGHLEQIIINLVVNASDAMPRGGRLTIETRRVERRGSGLEDRNAVLLAVTDTGTGMDAETQARAFDPFYTTKERGKGTGLGLSTVYGLVQQHGGDVWLYSEPGHGTTVKVYLPETERAPAERPSAAAADAPTGHETILVVEDEPGVRLLARRVLEHSGYTVLSAEAPAAALELAAGYGKPIDLLLTDVVMPGGSGTALAEALTARRPGMRTLFMSGYTEEAITGHGVLQSGIAFLEKPFEPAQLAKQVREVLGSVPPDFAAETGNARQ